MSVCSWTDSFYGYELDLSAFAGQVVHLYDDYYEKDYYWSICQNKENCNSSLTMLDEINNEGTCSCYYGTFDDGNGPSYDNSFNQWTFKYYGTWVGDYETEIKMVWHCNESVSSFYVTSFAFQCGQDSVLTNQVDIDSAAACPKGRTTTTTPPVPNCNWNDTAPNSKHYLDLEDISARTVSYLPDSNTPMSFYMYGICANANICGFSDFNMIELYDYNDFSNPCKGWYAAWDNGDVTPRYNVSSETWVFRYNNGQICTTTGQPTVSYIHWICNPSVQNAEMISAGQTDTCTYLFEVTSVYACN